ncbi:MAG TPA: hypothetical protein DCS87_16240 [Rheinheimera sp.]|nr:hypothetical protein [Rheinheimera sp.]
MRNQLKRSRKVALTLMVPASMVVLAGCSESSTEAAVFDTPEQCAQQFDREQCEADYKKAQAMHETVAPRYQTLAQCEADFGAGQCQAPQPTQQQQSTSSSFFMPLMMGYLAGQMFNGGNNSRMSPAQPLYRSKDDPTTYRTGANQPIARQTGVVSVPNSKLQTYSNTNLRRGGFGSQAQRRQEQSSASYSSYGG